MRPTSSGAKCRSWRSAAAWNVPARTRVTPSEASRERSSAPAFSVNVTASSCCGANAPVRIWCAIRRVIVVVFPEPAPARMLVVVLRDDDEQSSGLHGGSVTHRVPTIRR